MEGVDVLLTLVEVLDDAVLVEVVAELGRVVVLELLVVLEGDQLSVWSLGLVLQVV